MNYVGGSPIQQENEVFARLTQRFHSKPGEKAVEKTPQKHEPAPASTSPSRLDIGSIGVYAVAGLVLGSVWLLSSGTPTAPQRLPSAINIGGMRIDI